MLLYSTLFSTFKEKKRGLCLDHELGSNKLDTLRKTEKDLEGLERIFAEKEKKSKHPMSSLI